MAHVSPWIITLQLGAGVVAVATAGAALQHRDKPAGIPVVSIALAGAGWAFGAGFQPLTTDRELSFAFEMLQYFMADLVALSWLYIAVEYADRSWFQQRHVVAVPVSVVLVSAIASVTNPLHGLVLDPATTVDPGGTITAVQGPLYWPKIAWDYCIILVGIAILVVEVRKRTGTYRIQALAVLASGIIPSIAAAVAAVELLGIPGFTPSTVGISISGVILLWALFYADFLEVAPVARRTLVENMADAVIALDTDGRVIDSNSRARTLLDINENPVGKRGKEVFADYPELVSEFETELSAETDVAVTQNGEVRYYHLNISPVYTDGTGTLVGNADRQLLGRSIVLRDITERRRREEDLDLLKQVFARTLRHNIRNELMVVQGRTEVIRARTDDGEHDQEFEEILTKTDDLVQMSQKARSIEELVDAPRTRQVLDLSTVLRSALRSIGDSYPDATISVSLPEECSVRAHQRLAMAIENLVENGVEHAPDPPGSVTIDATKNGSTVSLVIEDEGPGIPESELDVIEAATETDLEHGSGLGLWIVKWVVDRSEGYIDFENTGSGCRVTLELDAADAA